MTGKSKDIVFSIIIPHYNIPHLLERLLLSIPYDKEDLQVIVVDDRSDKNVEELIRIKKRYEKCGVEFYRNNTGAKGPGTCRNIALRHAAGKWVIFADSDDYFTEGFYDSIKIFSDSRADMVYFIPESINIDTGNPSDRHLGMEKMIGDYLSLHDRRSELLLRYAVAAPWSKLYKRKMITDNNLFFPDMIVSEDAVFCCKCGYYAGEVEASKERIYVVTERENSLTTAVSTEKFKLQTDAFAAICRYIKTRVSREDWELLSFNGNLKMIEAVSKFGIKWALYVFLAFAANGIKPVSFKGMSLKTAPETLKKILKGGQI